ncbi:ATP-binding domain-containing protein [Lachnospiraceae bacterium 29-91]
MNPKRRGKAEIRNGKKLFRTGDIVMQTENKDEISNGDLGEILDIYRKEKKTAMRVDFGDGRIVEFTDEDHWPLTHGYAMSVHKSQGNECAVVIIPVLDCFWRMLQRILHCVSGKLTDPCRNCIKSPRNRSKNVLAFLCIYGERQEK